MGEIRIVSSGILIRCARNPITCKVYIGYRTTDEVQHGLSAYTADNPIAVIRGFSPNRQLNHAVNLTSMIL